MILILHDFHTMRFSSLVLNTLIISKAARSEGFHLKRYVGALKKSFWIVGQNTIIFDSST